MIDDTDIVTYRSDNAPREDLIWTAYVVLPNGNYWNVRFSGPTEEAVQQKAIELWSKELSRVGSGSGSGSNLKPKPSGLQPCVKSDQPSLDSPPDQTPLVDDPWASEKPSIWVIHKYTRERICIPLTEINMYEKLGFIRGGPRSQ